MKRLLALLIAVICLSTGMTVNAKGGKFETQGKDRNVENVTIELSKRIDESKVLKGENYDVAHISYDELPANVAPMRFDSVDDAIKYLEMMEQSKEYEITKVNRLGTNNIKGMRKAAAQTESYNIKYERSLTSCYTLSATVNVNPTTKKITSVYNKRFELSGVTLSIGIDNVNVYENYYDNNTKIRVRADYQHISYFVVQTSLFEISRSNCYQQMWYTYDKGCHDGSFGYR